MNYSTLIISDPADYHTLTSLLNLHISSEPIEAIWLSPANYSTLTNYSPHPLYRGIPVFPLPHPHIYN